MKHKYIEKLIQRQLDREINPEQERALNEHIADCDDCREFYQEITQTCLGLETMPDFYPSPDFDHRIVRYFGWDAKSAIKKLSAAAAAVWLTTLVALVVALSPVHAVNSLVKKAPAVMRCLQSVNTVFGALARLAAPFFRSNFDPAWIAFAAVLTLITAILLSRIAKREITCTVS